MAQIKRETAIICTIRDILIGSFVKTEGLTPSYFSTDRGNISRANIIGVVVNNDGEGFVVDDGTGRILLRSFEAQIGLDAAEVGSLVMIIGRPRIFNEQKYIVPEIIKKIDQGWAEFRKAYLELNKAEQVLVKKEVRIPVKEESPSTNPYQKVIGFIKDLDVGGGADINDVVKRSGLPGAEEVVKKLIEEGEIFEIKPGKLKLLT
jgi:RPA family protein